MNEYFDKSRWWWYIKYAKPYKDRATLIALCIGICTFSILIFIASAEAITQKFSGSITINISHDVDSISSIQPISHIVNSNDINMALFVISKYIENYETYSESSNPNYDFLQKVSRLARYSSKDIIDTITRDYNAKYSAILTNGGFQKVKIAKVYFEKPGDQGIVGYFKPEEMPSYFFADITIYTFDGSDLRKQEKTVKINLAFTPITKDDGDNRSPLKYTILSYEYV